MTLSFFNHGNFIHMSYKKKSETSFNLFLKCQLHPAVELVLSASLCPLV